MKRHFWLLVVLFVFNTVACTKETSADSISLLTTPSPLPQVIKAEAKITSEPASNVKTTETVFNPKENYSKVCFVDSNNGWVIGNDLYKTENAGKSWENIPIKVEKDANIRSVQFINKSVGWINIQKYGDVTGKISKSWLTKTIDGGKTWQNLLVQELTQIGEIKFIDEKNGWMIGETHNPENVYDSKQFFRKTNDGGQSWTEIGEELFKKNGFQDRDARQNITGFIAETPEKIRLVMWSGKLFETEDAGKSWKQFGPQFDFPAQTIPDNFGKIGNSNRLRMGRGTWSIEGIYSYVATEKNGDWTVRWTDEPVCFYDIAFLSENEMIAVGRLSVNSFKDNHQEDGVIYYSSDAGATWKIAYRNKKISEINSISEISDNKFIAVGSEGLVVNIELQK